MSNEEIEELKEILILMKNYLINDKKYDWLGAFELNQDEVKLLLKYINILESKGE